MTLVNELLTKTIRDSQRKKVYIAERPFHQISHKYETIKEVEQWLSKILKSEDFSTYKCYITGFKIKDGRRSRHARGWSYNNIAGMILPRWARNKMTILHELAHGICWSMYGVRKVAGHGPEWAQIFLDLVSKFDQEHYVKLKEEYSKLKITVKGEVMTKENKKHKWIVEYCDWDIEIYPISVNAEEPRSSSESNVEVFKSFGEARTWAVSHLTTGVRSYQNSINQVKALRRSKLIPKDVQDPKPKKIEYFAYLSNEYSKIIHFTKHSSSLAAEKHYGDPKAHWKGNAESDYEVTIY